MAMTSPAKKNACHWWGRAGGGDGVGNRSRQRLQINLINQKAKPASAIFAFVCRRFFWPFFSIDFFVIFHFFCFFFRCCCCCWCGCVGGCTWSTWCSSFIIRKRNWNFEDNLIFVRVYVELIDGELFTELLGLLRIDVLIVIFYNIKKRK